MPIDWKKPEATFRLLAAVYGALGEEPFKGKFLEIARLFGQDATYHTIKSEWRKVASHADRLLAASHSKYQSRDRVVKSSILKKRRPRRREVLQRQTHNVIVIDDDEGENVCVQSTLAVSDTPLVELDARSKRQNAGPDCVFCLDGEIALPLGTQTPLDIQSKNDRYSDTGASSFNPVQDANAYRLDSPSQRSGSDLCKPQNDDVLVPCSGTRTELPMSKLSGGLKTSPIEISGEVPFGQAPVSASRDDSLAPDLFRQPPFPELRMNDAQPHFSSASPEAGPSGYRPYRMPQGANEESQRDAVIADVIELGSSVDEARSEEGEYNGVYSLYEHATEGFTVSSPPPISYLDTRRLICYLCRAKLKESSQLLDHESTDYHLDRLNDEAAVEKGQASLRKYGLLRHSYNDGTTQARNALATGIESYGHYRPQTVISGEDRAAKFVGNVAMEDLEDALMESEDEVSDPYISDRNGQLHEVAGQIQQSKSSARDWANIFPAGLPVQESDISSKATRSQNKSRGLVNPSVQIDNGEEMAQVLQLGRFHLTRHVNQVLEAFAQALVSADDNPPESLDCLTPSFPLQILSAATETAYQANPGTRPNIWIIDTEYVSLPTDVGGVIPFSATITNLLSGATIANHRLELEIYLNELRDRIKDSGVSPYQFNIHYRDRCDLPIIKPRGLAHLLIAGGFKPADYIFVWAKSYTDYENLYRFLEREDLQYDLMPPEENTVRVYYAWKELLPGVPCGLEELFGKVFPDSPLNGKHHVADVDTKKLGKMAWKLRELKYIKGKQKQLDFSA